MRYRCGCRRPVVVKRSALAGYRFPPEIILVAVRWYLRFGLSYRDVEDRSVIVRRSKGMSDLATLLATPEREIHALDLASDALPRSPIAGRTGLPILDEPALVRRCRMLTWRTRLLVGTGEEVASHDHPHGPQRRHGDDKLEHPDPTLGDG